MPNPDADNVTYLLQPAVNPPRELHGPDPAEVVVGWDAGRATFFAHVSKQYPEVDGESYRAEAVRIGTAPYEANTAANVLNLIRPWAVLPPGLEQALEAAAGPHRFRQATVWSTNIRPGHGLPGRPMDLTDSNYWADLMADPTDISPKSDVPEWTVLARRTDFSDAAGPVIIHHQGALARDDALLTAVRLSARGRATSVSAFLGDSEQHTAQLVDWRSHQNWQVGWHISGLDRDRPDLQIALDRAIATVLDSAPESVAAQAWAHWQQQGGTDLTALAHVVWQHGYWPAYRDAHTIARAVLNTAAFQATERNPRAAATLDRLWARSDGPGFRAAPLSEDAVIAARLAAAASDRQPAWRAACDAVWHASRATARQAATTNAAYEFLDTWRGRGGETAAINLTINRRPAAELIHDLIQAVCQAPHSGADWTGSRAVNGTLTVVHLANELLASVSNPPDAAAPQPARPAGVHPAALAGTFHPPTPTAPARSKATGTTANSSRHDRPARRDPPGRHRAQG